METFSARLVFVLLIVATVGCQAEIHRAKAQRPQRAPPESTRQDLSGSGDEGKPENVWLYSFLGSVAVGMCGVFPLLVIPLEAGPALRKGAHAGRLKLMLSFAVGALLGDVFLHLLPEAWVHRGDPGEEKHGHNWVGLWTIAGIMSFLIMEKTFTNTAGEGKVDSEETSEEHRHTSHQENGSLPPYQDVSQIRRRSVHDKDSSGDKNGEVFKNGAITSSSPAANGKLKQENGPVNQNENSRNDRDSDNQPSQHIQDKICGRKGAAILLSSVDRVGCALALASVAHGAARPPPQTDCRSQRPACWDVFSGYSFKATPALITAKDAADRPPSYNV